MMRSRHYEILLRTYFVVLLLYYSMLKNGKYRGWFWGYPNITAAEVRCLSFHGHASHLQGVLQNLSAR